MLKLSVGQVFFLVSHIFKLSVGDLSAGVRARNTHTPHVCLHGTSEFTPRQLVRCTTYHLFFFFFYTSCLRLVPVPFSQ